MKDIVLLHGTTSGQDSYERFATALHRHGWATHGVDMPTDRGEWGTEDYAAFLKERLGEDVDGPVVLGHSGAGLLIESAGQALGARHLVWLAAYVPATGKSLRGEDFNAVFNDEWVGVDPTSDDVAAAYFLFHDCDYDTLRWALTTSRLWYPAAVYDEPAVPRGPRSPPATVIVAKQDRTIRPEWSRRAATTRLGVTAVEVDSGHCPHVSQPELLAEVLSAAVPDP